MKITLPILVFINLGIKGLYAQESVNTTGGDASSNTGSISYSIGQTVYDASSNDSGSINQGVQQPFEISVITDSPKFNNIHLAMTAYPNPTFGRLTLKASGFELSDLNIQIHDLQGKILQSTKLVTAETQIEFQDYKPATYFVRVTANNQLAKVFKIIKK
ncbi:MAG: T9SS type A sorting domain-containing protein [bacterium]|nr:T9SS type A sorting domain-containing protein [bacterium]